MPDHRRKSRTISFRVSEAEYELLRLQCRNLGARSVSDLTRLAIHRITEDHAFEVSMGSSLQSLQSRIAELEQKLNSLGSDFGSLSKSTAK